MIEPHVIYEDENFLAVDKPAGLLVHQTLHSDEDEPTLVKWLLKQHPEIADVGDDPAARPGIVHRLDKATSGVLIISKNQIYFEYLKDLFKKRLVKKVYLALVFGKVKNRNGTIDLPVGYGMKGLKRTTRGEKASKEAVTSYRVLSSREKASETCTLLQVSPHTGRTHQIRVHLASLGNPVVGDKLYGRRVQPAWVTRLMLHALSIEFAVAPGRRLKIEAAPPEEFNS